MDQARLNVRVTPKSSANEVTGVRGEAICIKLTAPPVDGAANSALIKLVAEKLGVPKSRVRLLSGERGRNKIIEVDGIDSQTATFRLTGNL